MYLRGSVWLVSVDVSCFLPYEGAANCTLYFLLDLQFYLISDLLCDNADIDPLWFLGGRGVLFFLFFFFFSFLMPVVKTSRVVWVTFQHMHVEPKHAQALLFFFFFLFELKTELKSLVNPVATCFSSLRSTNDSVIWRKSCGAKGRV